MIAGNPKFISAHILDTDAGTVTDPRFHLFTTLIRVSRLNWSNSCHSLVVRFPNPAGFSVIFTRFQRVSYAPAHINRHASFDSHPTYIGHYLFVLLYRIAARQKSVIMAVPDAHVNKRIAC